MSYSFKRDGNVLSSAAMTLYPYRNQTQFRRRKKLMIFSVRQGKDVSPEVISKLAEQGWKTGNHGAHFGHGENFTKNALYFGYEYPR